MNTYRFEGNISVKAAMLAGHRNITKIIVDEAKKDKDTNFILHEASRRFIPIEKTTREKIDQLAQGKTHGGLIAYGEERTFQQLQDIIYKEDVYLGLLEGIEDPYNFGYILRTLYAAGVDGVIIPKRNWTTASDVVCRASAGASEYLSLIVAHDMEALLKEMKEQKIAMICADRKDAISLYDYEFPKRLCIAIGGEMRGLSNITRAASDQNIFIPYGREVRNALNAASAASVISFEIMRQRMK